MQVLELTVLGFTVILSGYKKNLHSGFFSAHNTSIAITKSHTCVIQNIELATVRQSLGRIEMSKPYLHCVGY